MPLPPEHVSTPFDGGAGKATGPRSLTRGPRRPGVPTGRGRRSSLLTPPHRRPRCPGGYDPEGSHAPFGYGPGAYPPGGYPPGGYPPGGYPPPGYGPAGYGPAAYGPAGPGGYGPPAGYAPETGAYGFVRSCLPAGLRPDFRPAGRAGASQARAKAVAMVAAAPSCWAPPAVPRLLRISNGSRHHRRLGHLTGWAFAHDRPDRRCSRSRRGRHQHQPRRGDGHDRHLQRGDHHQQPCRSRGRAPSTS